MVLSDCWKLKAGSDFHTGQTEHHSLLDSTQRRIQSFCWLFFRPYVRMSLCVLSCCLQRLAVGVSCCEVFLRVLLCITRWWSLRATSCSHLVQNISSGWILWRCSTSTLWSLLPPPSIGVVSFSDLHGILIKSTHSDDVHLKSKVFFFFFLTWTALTFMVWENHFDPTTFHLVCPAAWFWDAHKLKDVHMMCANCQQLLK